MQAVDTLLQARWIIPVEPENRVLDNHALVIRQGRILDILPTEQAKTRYTAAECIELPTHALIPGLVNAHTHAPMTLLRGLADDLPLMTWLQEHIWPAEMRWVSEAFVHDGTCLAMAEMLRGGVTCFNDMYFFPDATAAAVRACGMRACIGLIVVEFPSPWAETAEDYIQKGLALHAELGAEPLLHRAFAPHAPYTVGDAALRRVGVLAGEHALPVHIHVHESAVEIAQSLEQHGCRPLARLEQLGLLSPRLIAVHMTQLEDAEIERLAATGAKVVHCPESNLKLASGFCPVAKLAAAGVPVALGTDGAASNNDLDLFGEMRIAALLGKALAGNPAVLPAATALRMATLDGARALGLDDIIGSLAIGKWADLAAVDLGTPETEPVYNPVSQLVYATGRQQVTDVWVAGRQLLRQRTLTTLELDNLVDRARQWRAKIAA